MYGARLFSDVIGDVLIHLPLEFVYSTSGLLLRLALVGVLSALQATLVSY